MILLVEVQCFEFLLALPIAFSYSLLARYGNGK